MPEDSRPTDADLIFVCVGLICTARGLPVAAEELMRLVPRCLFVLDVVTFGHGLVERVLLRFSVFEGLHSLELRFVDHCKEVVVKLGGSNVFGLILSAEKLSVNFLIGKESASQIVENRLRVASNALFIGEGRAESRIARALTAQLPCIDGRLGTVPIAAAVRIAPTDGQVARAASEGSV